MLTFSSLQLDTLENKLSELTDRKKKMKMKISLKLIKKTKKHPVELYRSSDFRTLFYDPEPITEQTYETALHRCDAVMQKEVVPPTANCSIEVNFDQDD